MLYLKNAKFIDWKTFELKAAHIKVHKGTQGTIEFIDKVPDKNELKEDDKIFDCKGKIVTKSFGCGHHHIYSALAVGMPAPKKIPINFNQVLEYIWWNLDKCLDLEIIEASALVTAINLAKNGVTMVIDHHASPFAVKGSLQTISDAFNKIGVSHLLCYELSDRDGEKVRDQGLLEHEAYFSKLGLGHVGLHASFTVSDDLLKDAVALAKKFNTGIHIHVAEDKADQDDCVNNYGKRVVERFNDFGVLDLSPTILSHCIHVDEKEKELIKSKNTWIVENIESNQNNNVGISNYSSITDKVMLGTDGMHSDMLRSAKAAFLAGQSVERVGMDTIYNRFRNIHYYINENKFSCDTDNNLVILDYQSATEVTAENFLGHFIYGLNSDHVDSVISSGKMIVENKKLTCVDEEEVFANSRKMGNRLWERMKKRIYE